MVQFCYLQLYIVGHYRKLFPAVSCYGWQGTWIETLFFYVVMLFLAKVTKKLLW